MQGRNINKVIADMLEHIPVDDELYDKVDHVRKDVCYKAPEMWSSYWYDLWIYVSAMTEGTEFKDLQEWQKKVLGIYTTKTRKQLEEK